MRLKIFSNLLAVSLFVFSALLIFWPVLFGGKIVDDFFGLDLSHYKFTKDFGETWQKNGSFRLWWPNYLGGFPVYLTQVGFFNPLVLFFYNFFSGFSVYNWITFFNFVLAGLATYWFARILGLGLIASSVTALAYTFSQNSIYWGPTLPFSNVYVFIPLFFGALWKLSQNKSWPWLILGGLITAYGFLAGESQIVFFTLFIGFFWALFLNFHRQSKQPLLSYFIFLVIGLTLASFWVLPVLDYLKLTVRGEALSFSDLAYDFMRIADPLRFFYPYVQLPQFTGFESLGIVPNYYVGALTFILAAAAIFLVRKNKTIAFWFGVAAFAILIRIKWSGIFWVLHFLPGFDRFRGVFHWSFIGSFALALLAGYGLDNLDKIKESLYFKKFINVLKIFGWVNIAAVFGIFLIGLFKNQILTVIFRFFDARVYPGTRQFPLEHYHGVIASEFHKFLNAFSLSDFHFLISLVSVLGAILLFLLYQKERINFENFKKSALIFVFLNLVLIWQGYYNFILQSKITEYPDTVQFIKDRYNNTSIQRCIEVDCRFRFFRFYPPESYQVFSVFEVKDWTDYKLKTLESNIGPYFDMDSFGGVEPFLSQRIADVFNEIGFERPTTVSGEPWLRSTKLSLDEKIKRFSSSQNQNLFSMLNIKYIFSSFRLPNLKLVYETTATEKNIPVYIYENPEVLPRIYFAKRVEFVDSKNAFEELLKIKNFKELTLIECQEECPSTQFSIFNFQFSNIEVEEFKPEFIKIETKTSQDNWLVYSDANLPTWEAYIDGQKTQVYTANYLFKAVHIPKGEREVKFEYPGIFEQDRRALENLFGTDSK